MKIRKNNKGFTLLEIIIVVAIISVLAVILLPRLARVRQPANDARRISDLRTIQGYLELYYQKNRAYPLSSLFPVVGYGSIENTTDCGSATVCNKLISDGVASAIPSDPTSGSVYNYGTDSNGQSYTIGATLQESGSRALSDDVDGSNVNGVNCDGQVYCVQF